MSANLVTPPWFLAEVQRLLQRRLEENLALLRELRKPFTPRQIHGDTVTFKLVVK